MTTTTLPPRLSSIQVATYQREGYLVVREPVLPPERFAALQRHFEGMLAALPAGARPEHMDVPHFADPALYRWLLDDAVLDLVEPLIGPDIALFSSHFICKPAGDGKRVGWHEDSTYWRTMMDRQEVVTVWLAIDAADADNGAMQVVPRTHDHGFSDYVAVSDPGSTVFPDEIKPGHVDLGRAVTIDLLPNQASLHHAKLIHGSAPNRSKRRRCGFTMRYVSTRVRFDHERCPWHRLILARGRDHAGNAYGDPARAMPEVLAARSVQGAAVTGH